MGSSTTWRCCQRGCIIILEQVEIKCLTQGLYDLLFQISNASSLIMHPMFSPRLYISPLKHTDLCVQIINVSMHMCTHDKHMCIYINNNSIPFELIMIAGFTLQLRLSLVIKNIFEMASIRNWKQNSGYGRLVTYFFHNTARRIIPKIWYWLDFV